MSEPALIQIENKYRLLSNLNQTVNQICKAVKVNDTDIWLRSENFLHQREKPLWGSQTQEINCQKKYLITRSSYSQPFAVVTFLNSNKRLLVCLFSGPVWRVLLLIP
jgi:hypothetical protein